MAILSGQEGISIIAVIIMMLLIAVMGQVLVSMVGTENFATVNQMQASQAHYIAEAGVERAMYEFENGTACNILTYNDPVGTGNYTTSGTVYNPVSSTLFAAILSADVTIPVVSIAGYAPHGRVTIESEEIDYSASSNVPAVCAPVASPCLTAAQRGANGTTAAGHAVGVLVGQDQCLIRSTGSVPGFSGVAQRVIEAGTTQQSTTGSTVQTGTATSVANGTLTVPIPTAVNMAGSFLIFNTRHNSNRPVGSMVRGRIATAATMEFVRVTNEGVPVPITIRWYVVEFSSGVIVQRGSVNQVAAVINVPLATPVASLAQAFVTWSKTPGIGDNIWSQDDPIVGDLSAPGNLQFRVNNANGNHVIWWQVIEFTNPADILVQRGTTSLTGGGPGALSVNVILGTPVDVNETFVLVGFRTGGTGADVGQRMLRAQLIDSTTILIDRSSGDGGDPITEIVWQAVELNSSTVQGGTQNFPVAAVPQIVVTLDGNVREVNAGAISIEEAQSGPPEAIATNINIGPATITTPITTLTDGAWLIDVVGSGDGGSYTPGAGQTERWDSSVFTATGASGTKLVATAGLDSMTQTHNTPSNRTAHVVVSVAPNAIGVPITFDAQSSSQDTNAATLTWPHLVGGGANRKLLVGVAVEENNTVGGDENVISITYDGANLAYVGEVTVTTGNNFLQHVEIWYLDEVDMPTGTSSTQIVPIAVVDTSRAAAFASVQPVGGQNMGRSPYLGDDIIGVGSVTMALSTNQITMRRDNTAATADIGWFVVEFGTSGGGMIDWREIF